MKISLLQVTNMMVLLAFHILPGQILELACRYVC